MSCACEFVAAQEPEPPQPAAAGENGSAAPAAEAVGDLASRTRAEQGTYSPHTSGDLAAAQTQLLAALGQLDRYLNTGGANGRNWKRYLLWEEMQAQLRSPTLDLSELERVYLRYRADHAGLELPIWRNVALAMRAYLDLAEEASDPKAPEVFDSQLSNLAEHLEAFGKAGVPEDLEHAADSLEWLERRRQARSLVRQIRRRLSQPNLYVHLTQELISAGAGRPVDETEPVRDVILGTRISGNGRTVGQVLVKLIPNPNSALLETVLEGVNYARTVGANGPARIGSTSRTQLLGRQRMSLDARGFQALAPETVASARSHIYGVWSTKHGLVDHLVRHVARKRIPRQKRQSEAIASRHAEQRLNRRLAAELNRELKTSNADYLEKFRNPLVRLGEFPERFEFSTSANEMRFLLQKDGLGRLAAPFPPPEPQNQPALTVRFHESLPNNFAQGLLAGQTLNRTQFEQLSLRYMGRVPTELQDEEPKGPWSITFAQRAPVTVRIGPSLASITIRGLQFSSDVRQFDEPMNITAHYQLSREAGTIKAVRQGELEIFPPGFKPNSGRRLPTRLIGFRNLLKHRFDKIFRSEIASEGLILPGHWQQLGKLELTEMQTQRGWMLLGWRPQPSGKSRLAGYRASPAAQGAEGEGENLR
ncbi:MAG TPA: hypothetical protein VMV10_18845 [Pirellulales bacterium]|nr:hypothetical protein [Pirellulales bacterium]